MNDRGVVPTTPVFTWTVWFSYSLALVLKGKIRQGLILAGLLVSIIWHINVALVLLTPLIVLVVYFSRKKLKLMDFIYGASAFIVTSIPFIAFELRHSFSQIKYVITSFTTDQGSGLTPWSQFNRVIHIASQERNHAYL